MRIVRHDRNTNDVAELVIMWVILVFLKCAFQILRFICSTVSNFGMMDRTHTFQKNVASGIRIFILLLLQIPFTLFVVNIVIGATFVCCCSVPIRFVRRFECVLIQHLLIFPFLMSYTFDLIYYLLRPFCQRANTQARTHTHSLHDSTQ